MRKFLLSARFAATGLLPLMISVAAIAQTAPAVGQPAPNFTLSAADGSSITLSSLHGQWVVVFFLPSTTDSGSVSEVKSFQGDLSQYSKWGSVVGVSPSSAALLKQLALNTNATYPLLSDPKGATAKAYGSLAANGQVSRNAFLIDPQGNISQVWTSVAPATISSQMVSNLSLKPPVGTVSPATMSLKPPVP